jgi:hypothetical protein
MTATELVRSAQRGIATAALLCIAATISPAQVNTRPIKPAEQAWFDRVAAEFAKLLPPVPAGWSEVERRVFDPAGMVSDWEAPHQADYEVQLVVSDLETRQKAVDAREQATADRNKGAFDAAEARSQKIMNDFQAKLEAALKKNDQAAVEKLQADFAKQIAANAAGNGLQKSARPELSDSYARIRLSINPYSASQLEEKKLANPTGFVWAGRREQGENTDDREGVSRYILGAFVPDGNGGYTLKFTPNKHAVVYGLVIEIEARADRADALFRAMNVTRLKALLQ